MIGNKVPAIKENLNGHNAKVFSGIEQIFVARLSAQERVNLIQSYYRGVYQTYEFQVSKLSFNDIGNSLSNSKEIELDKEVPKIKDDNSLGGEKEDEKGVAAAARLIDMVHVIPIDPKKSKFNVKTQGEHKGKTFISEVTAFVKGAGKITVEFFFSLINTDIIVIFKDANGNFRLLFDPVYEVEMEVEQDSGEGLASEAGFTVTFTSQSKLPPIYVYGIFDIAGLRTEDGFEKIATVNTAPVPKEFLDETGCYANQYIQFGQQNKTGV